MPFAVKDLSSLNMLGKNLGDAVQNQFRNDLQAAKMEREMVRRNKVQSTLNILSQGEQNPNPIERNKARASASNTLQSIGDIEGAKLVQGRIEKDPTNTTPFEYFMNSPDKAKATQEIANYTSATQKAMPTKIIKSSRVVTNDKGERVTKEIANIYQNGQLLKSEPIGEKPYVDPLSSVNASIFMSQHKTSDANEQKDIDRVLKISDDIKQIEKEKRDTEFLIESGQLQGSEQALQAAENRKNELDGKIQKYNDDISGIVQAHKNWTQKGGAPKVETPKKKVDDPLGIL